MVYKSRSNPTVPGHLLRTKLNQADSQYLIELWENETGLDYEATFPEGGQPLAGSKPRSPQKPNRTSETAGGEVKKQQVPTSQGIITGSEGQEPFHVVYRSWPVDISATVYFGDDVSGLEQDKTEAQRMREAYEASNMDVGAIVWGDEDGDD